MACDAPALRTCFPLTGDRQLNAAGGLLRTGRPVTDMRDVPAAVLKWRVRWDDLLALEPRIGGAGPGSRPPAGPDRLVVHRKGRPGMDEQQPLAEQLRAYSTVPQVVPCPRPCSRDLTQLLVLPKPCRKGNLLGVVTHVSRL